MSNKEFEKEIEETLSNIDQTIEEVRRRADQRGISPYVMRHVDGTFAMERLLNAKDTATDTLNLLKGLDLS